MSISRTEIANQALTRIGAQRITDLDDDSVKNARVCRVVFDPTIREIGRMADWNCLMKRETIGQLSTAPAFGWDHQYQLPADYLRMVKLNGHEYRGQPGDEFDVEGGRLLTDAEEANVLYVAYTDDSAKYDSLLVAAIVTLLGAKMAVTIAGDRDLASGLMTEFERLALPKGRSKDAGERKMHRFNPAAESTFVRSRFYSTNG